MESWLTEKAIEFLNNQRDTERPWFLYVSFGFPHPPFNVPDGFEALYQGKEIGLPKQPRNIVNDHSHPHGKDVWPELSSTERQQSILRYYALCSYVDTQFGRILDQVKKLGETENTYIVFIADHGEMLGDRGRVSKYSLYESSVRVPCIISGPDLPNGVIDDRLAELVDILPTILDLVGLRHESQLPGYSLVSSSVRRGQFSELHGRNDGGESTPAYMWRTAKWKLILPIPAITDHIPMCESAVRKELYNLVEDPLEFVNLYYDPEYKPQGVHMMSELLMHIARAWTRYPSWNIADNGTSP
jgi:arylsulfatase A-like enzyme